MQKRFGGLSGKPVAKSKPRWGSTHTANRWQQVRAATGRAPHCYGLALDPLQPSCSLSYRLASPTAADWQQTEVGVAPALCGRPIPVHRRPFNGYRRPRRRSNRQSGGSGPCLACMLLCVYNLPAICFVAQLLQRVCRCGVPLYDWTTGVAHIKHTALP